jgi:hypothetical protein
MLAALRSTVPQPELKFEECLTGDQRLAIIGEGLLGLSEGLAFELRETQPTLQTRL